MHLPAPQRFPLFFEKFFRLFFQFSQLGLNFFQDRFLHPVDIQDSFQVIHLVLNATSQKPVAAQVVKVALQILIPHPDPVGSPHHAIDTGEREATFQVFGFPAWK